MLQTDAIGHVEHRAGDQMYVDFAGNRLEIVDEATAEVRKVEVFVAILPCSHYTYCEAVWSQKKEDLVKACENAIHFYGGAPCAILPDNLKSAVTRSDRNEPVINADFEAFADHYGCAVVPARVRHPKDKALVENAVKLMCRSVYVDLEGMVFHNLESLNEAILKSVAAFNARNLTRRKESRRQLFEAVEKDSLHPLQTNRYQMRQRAVIEDRRYPELAFRVCRGIMKLEKKYGQERLVSGCAAAMDARLYSVSDMVDILESGADADYLPGADADGNERLTPAHRNIRGKEYFAASIKQSTNNDNEQNGNKR